MRAFLDNCPICNAKRRSGVGGGLDGGADGGHCSSFVDDELLMDDDVKNDDEV